MEDSNPTPPPPSPLPPSVIKLAVVKQITFNSTRSRKILVRPLILFLINEYTRFMKQLFGHWSGIEGEKGYFVRFQECNDEEVKPPRIISRISSNKY